MNGIFKSRRKAKDPQDPEPGQSFLSKSLTRKQKRAPAAAPDFDLSSALPDRNEFRTSLIMPGLTARFSMLREQNDPNTLIGKASDDSVLFPSRASRLNLFKHNPLADIAETDSIYSVRPPFASTDRAHSFSDGCASDDGGSIMNRTKPGEGNNLFGGRQKLYRVIDSSGSTSATTGGLGERHVYQSDAASSMWRDSSRGRFESDDEDVGRKSSFAEAEETDTVQSPDTPFSRNRGTTSSTASAPSNGRSSTAATSLGSESPACRQTSTRERNPISRTSNHSNASFEHSVVPKRMHSSTDPSPSLPGGEGLVEKKDISPKKSPKRLSQSRSATNLREMYVPSPPPFSIATTGRATLPKSDSPIKSQVSSVAREIQRSPSPKYHAVSPTAALFGDSERMSTLDDSLEPNDRGKATALGFFNRPQRQFDEQQFSKRQLQMAEGRISPFSSRGQDSRAESRNSSEPVDTGANRPLESHRSSTEQAMMLQESESPAVVEVATDPVGQAEQSSSHTEPVVGALVEEEPKDSTQDVRPTTARQRTKSSASTVTAGSNVPQVDQMFKAQVDSLIRRQNAELEALEAVHFAQNTGTDRSTHNSVHSSTGSSIAHGTFFDSQDVDSDESNEAFEHHSATHTTDKPPTEVHPALRDGLKDFVFTDDAPSTRMTFGEVPFNGLNEQVVPAEMTTPMQSPSDEKNFDSPTLPAPGLGLSGLVRTHLRQDSDRSSVFPQPSPELPQNQFDISRNLSVASTTRTGNPPASVRSDPWELDKTIDESNFEANPRPDGATAAMFQRAQAIRAQAENLKNQSRNKAQRVLGDDVPNSAPLDPPNRPWRDNGPPSAPLEETPRPWQEEVRAHQRNTSSMTAKSRQDFDEELAERRRRVQQKLKTDVRERMPSHRVEDPMASPDYAPPMNYQRQVPPEHFVRQPKAMKMLGLQGPPRSGGPARGAQEDQWAEMEARMLQDFGRKPKPRSPPHAEAHSGRAPYGGPVRNGSEDEYGRQRQRSVTPSSGGRNRSTSEAANRSRSRPAYREDERAPSRDGQFRGPPRAGYRTPSRGPGEYRAPSRGSGDNRGPSRGPGESRAPSRGANGYERSESAMSGRYRSDSRAQAPGYFDRPPPPSMPDGFGHPRASPRIPAQSPIISPRPPQGEFDSSSPAPSGPNSPEVSNYPLPSTGRTTPSANGRTTPVGGAGARKKSVTKNMISEPTLVSTTSSIPLVGRDQAPAADGTSPPVPVRNPGRNRTPTNGQPNNPFQFLRPDLRPQAHGNVGASLPQNPRANLDAARLKEESGKSVTVSDDNAVRAPRVRNKLRKTSSEGGSIAAKVRNQKMLAELQEMRSPAVPNFSRKDGEMF